MIRGVFLGWISYRQQNAKGREVLFGSSSSYLVTELGRFLEVQALDSACSGFPSKHLVLRDNCPLRYPRGLEI